MSDAKRRHRCPAWCHRCPDLVAIVTRRRRENNETDPLDKEVEYCMPGCMGGVYYGVAGCHCDTAPTARKTYRLTLTMSERSFNRLSDLIGAPYNTQRYEDRAAQILTHALNAKPKLAAVSGGDETP